MLTYYVLIDFENVQPKNLEILANHPFKVFVFVGENQTKVSFDQAVAMQSMGENAKYIKISGNGRNALDFHVAYYLGELAAKHPDGKFSIISKDTGFDPLVRHLKTRKLRVQRLSDLAEIPVLKMGSALTLDEKIDAIVQNLVGRGQSRPRKEKTLSNTINTLFTKKLDEKELGTVIKALCKKGYVSIDQGKVTYDLPK